MNGHKNWNHWNVALWIANDEPLYDMARAHVRRADNRDEAAGAMLEELEELGVTETLDGAPFTKTSIRAALRDL